MMNRSILLLLPALVLTAAGPPPDKPTERPAMMPTRDVVVGYHIAPPTGETVNVRVSLQAGGGAIRVDLPDQSFMVATPPDKGLVMVVPLQQTAMTMPWVEGPQSLFTLDPRMSFTRKADATIAGQRCTNWDATLERVHSTVCVSPDGVVLRSQTELNGRRGTVEAFAVRYQALVESDFAIPAGFDKLTAVPEHGTR